MSYQSIMNGVVQNGEHPYINGVGGGELIINGVKSNYPEVVGIGIDYDGVWSEYADAWTKYTETWE